MRFFRSAKPLFTRTFGNARGAVTVSILILFCAGAAFARDNSVQGDRAPGKRIFISVDMEGVVGVVTPGQLSPDGFDYQQARIAMTNEVNAAIAGARRAGATEFVIADSHGNFQNLLIDLLPKDAKIIRGTNRPLIMMEGIQNDRFDGVMFIGYHAGATRLTGVRAHSFSSAGISDLRVNGIPASEGYWNAAIAGEFGAPVLLVSGDDVASGEFARIAPGAEQVAVKRAISFHSAETITPAAGFALIESASERALTKPARVAPFRIKGPLTIDLTFHFYQPAEVLSWLPMFERTGSRSVRYRAKNVVEATKLLAFILTYSAGLQP